MGARFGNNQKQHGRSNMWQTVVWLTDVFDYEHLKGFLDGLQIPCCSVCHNKDCYDSDVTEDGKLKHVAGAAKPIHAHVIFKFDSLKSLAQVQDLCAGIKFATNDHFEKCVAPSACMRYLCHLDHPEKVQYAIEEVDTFSGFSYDPFKKLSPEAKAALIPEIIKYIEEERISSYAYLCRFVAFNRPELIPVVMKDFSFGLKCYCESLASTLPASGDDSASDK